MADKKDLIALAKSDPELFKSVLLDSIRRLHNAYGGSNMVAIHKALLDMFPDDKEAIEKFLANTGKTVESIPEVSLSVASSKKSDVPSDPETLANLVDKLGIKDLAKELKSK